MDIKWTTPIVLFCMVCNFPSAFGNNKCYAEPGQQFEHLKKRRHDPENIFMEFIKIFRKISVAARSLGQLTTCVYKSVAAFRPDKEQIRAEKPCVLTPLLHWIFPQKVDLYLHI